MRSRIEHESFEERLETKQNEINEITGRKNWSPVSEFSNFYSHFNNYKGDKNEKS